MGLNLVIPEHFCGCISSLMLGCPLCISSVKNLSCSLQDCIATLGVGTPTVSRSQFWLNPWIWDWGRPLNPNIWIQAPGTREEVAMVGQGARHANSPC